MAVLAQARRVDEPRVRAVTRDARRSWARLMAENHLGHSGPAPDRDRGARRLPRPGRAADGGMARPLHGRPRRGGGDARRCGCAPIVDVARSIDSRPRSHLGGSPRARTPAQPRPAGHRPAARAAALAGGSGVARRADAQRRRAAPDGHQLHARVHRHRDVLAQPRDLADREVPVAPRRDADAHRGRPVPRRAQLPGRAAHRRRPGAQRRGAAGAARARLLPRAASARAEERQRARAAARHRHARDAAARARLPRCASRASGTSRSR